MKKRSFRIFAGLILFGFYGYSSAQQNPLAELSGQNPSRLKWFEISDSNYRIIFPSGSETIAEHILNTLRTTRDPVSRSLDAHLRKLNVVIQSQNTDNNGFVTSGARRAEFYNTPPQNPFGLGLNDWFEELCVHEYRHVVQLDNAKQGWGKGLYFLFGNTGLTMAEGITNPWWFWEGDAVGCETVFGFGGRGRLPAFDATFRMQLLTGTKYSYSRAVCGSMKKMVPNHYVLGYFMTSYVKNKYGVLAWDSILSLSYHRTPWPFTFNRCTKTITGQSLKQVYRSMTTELKDSAMVRMNAMPKQTVTYIHNPTYKVFTQYRFPCYLPDGSMVAMKSGLGDAGLVAYKSSSLDFDKLVWIRKDSSEKVLCLTGVLDDNGRIGCAGFKAVWTETTYDKRWGARNYTDVFMFDLKKNKRYRITKKQRLHAPVLAPDEKTILAVRWDTKSLCNLVFVDVKSGKIIRVFANPKNEFYMQPTFSEDGKYIVYLKSKPGFKSIWKMEIATEKETEILTWIPENISTPIINGKFVYYNSPVYGIDNVFALDTATRQVYMITTRPFGAYNPSVSKDGKFVAFYDLQPKGARIGKIANDTSAWTPIYKLSLPGKVRFYNGYIKQEGGNILTHIPSKDFKIKRFRRWKNSFNIYGWGYQLASSSPDVRVGLNSQDLLSTTQFDAGVSWERNEKNFGKYATLRYLGFYPVLSLSYIDGGRSDFYSFKGAGDVFDSSGRYHYQNFDFTVSLPLNFSVGRFIKKMNLSASGTFNTISTAAVFTKRYDETPRTAFYGLKFKYSYQVALRQSIRDVAPRLGYGLEAEYQKTPFGTYIKGEQYAVDAQILLPGIGKHHASRIRAMYQNNSLTNYFFKNAYFFARGAQNTLCKNLILGTAEYKFPEIFPDLDMLGFLYIQRARATLFTDIGRGELPPSLVQNGKKYQDFRTVGIEQTFDANILRFLIPVNMGVRASYDLLRKAYTFEFLFSVTGY